MGNGEDTDAIDTLGIYDRIREASKEEAAELTRTPHEGPRGGRLADDRESALYVVQQFFAKPFALVLVPLDSGVQLGAGLDVDL